jgi:hypothetical protein
MPNLMAFPPRVPRVHPATSRADPNARTRLRFSVRSGSGMYHLSKDKEKINANIKKS